MKPSALEKSLVDYAKHMLKTHGLLSVERDFRYWRMAYGDRFADQIEKCLGVELADARRRAKGVV